jgi:hypothetical protein
LGCRAIEEVTVTDKLNRIILLLLIVVFWILMPCSLVGGHQHFEEVYHLNLQGKIEHGSDMLL